MGGVVWKWPKFGEISVHSAGVLTWRMGGSGQAGIRPDADDRGASWAPIRKNNGLDVMMAGAARQVVA
jgi:hypothetical protein